MFAKPIVEAAEGGDSGARDLAGSTGAATAPGEDAAADPRAAIAALEAQARRYQTAIDGVSQGVCFFDGAERLILCNHLYSKLYRIAPALLRPGMTLSEILALRAAAGTSATLGADAYLDHARSINASHGPKTWTADLEDGRTIQIHHQPMSDGGWVSTHEDITEAKTMRAARNERISLQALIDEVPDYLWVKDAESRFVVVNRALASDNRRASTSDMIGLSDFDLHSPEAAQEFRADELRILTTGQPTIDREECIIDASGARKWLLSTKMPLRNERDEIFGLVGVARDITKRVRIADELRRAREFLNLIVENVPEAILVRDVRHGRVTLINRAAEEFLGMRRDDVLGRTAAEIYPAEFLDVVRKDDEELLRRGEMSIDNRVVELRGKASRIVTLNRKLLNDGDGAPEFMLTMMHDVTERVRAEERIAHLARHDPLTDLPNRFMFNERLEAALDRAVGATGRFAVVCIDLDRLKEVNDVFGHAAGDHLLCEVSRRLLTAAGDAFLARLGGDEFALVAEDIAPLSRLTALTNRLLATTESDLNYRGVPIRSGLSVGVAVFPEDGRDATTLLANADAALYRAKAEGRGVTRFFKADMDKRLRERHALRHDLSMAIEREELSMFYQPQAEVTGKIVGFEALLRWAHPLRGFVPPNKFIPVAEESHLIVRIGEWVLREVCREAASWPRPLNVAVNLSPVQFQHGDLPSLVHSVLIETGLAPDRLELEITEGVLIADSSRGLSLCVG